MHPMVGQIAQTIGGLAFPWGGFAVSLGGAVGGLAAKDGSVPHISIEPDPSCPPGSIDLGCLRTRVGPGEPQSVLGDWVPDWWVAMGGIDAGVLASVITAAVLVLIAVWLSIQRQLGQA